jgi:hypothetical protein
MPARTWEAFEGRSVRHSIVLKRGRLVAHDYQVPIRRDRWARSGAGNFTHQRSPVTPRTTLKVSLSEAAVHRFFTHLYHTCRTSLEQR